MQPRFLAFLPLLACACLSREIDAYIDGLVATSSTTDSSSETGSTGEAGASDAQTAETSGETSHGPDPATATATTSEDPDTGAATSTGTGESPVCGDGVLHPDEECDDGNDVPDDGCSNSCAADLRVFVTSKTYRAGQLMGLYLADAICLNRADDAGLPNPHRFKAWLSDSTEHARDRFNRDRRGRLVMVNGLVLAADWDALLASELENPLEVTEISTTYHGKVWTGTTASGAAAQDTDHCMDWTTDSPLSNGYYGYSDEISFEWTLADQIDNPLPCYPPLAIYCFESF